MTTRAKLFTTLVAMLAGLTLSGRAEPASPLHVIYLHGWIVQDRQDPRPEHPRFGYYELEEILGVFRDRGFVVTGEIRPKAATVGESADHVVGQIRGLLESGVPGDRILVVGASMGASIALLVSARLQEPDVGYALLGTCLSGGADRIREQEERWPSGRILAIREASDALTESCTSWEDDAPGPSSPRVEELVLDTGLGHGFLYRPMAEWMDPLLAWLGHEDRSSSG